MLPFFIFLQSQYILYSIDKTLVYFKTPKEKQIQDSESGNDTVINPESFVDEFN